LQPGMFSAQTPLPKLTIIDRAFEKTRDFSHKSADLCLHRSILRFPPSAFARRRNAHDNENTIQQAMLFLLLGGEGQDEGELPAHGVPNTFWSGSAVQNALPKPDISGRKQGGCPIFRRTEPETRNQEPETLASDQKRETKNSKPCCPHKTHPKPTRSSPKNHVFPKPMGKILPLISRTE